MAKVQVVASLENRWKNCGLFLKKEKSGSMLCGDWLTRQRAKIQRHSQTFCNLFHENIINFLHSLKYSFELISHLSLISLCYISSLSVSSVQNPIDSFLTIICSSNATLLWEQRHNTLGEHNVKQEVEETI